MYVKTTRVRRGNRTYEYLSLVEAVREDGKPRHRTLLRLGEATALRNSGELDRIVTALGRFLDEPAGGRTADVGELEMAADAAPAMGAVAVVWALWCRLGLDEFFGMDASGDAVFAMVANRLIAPGAKRRIPEWARADVAMPDGFGHPPLHRYYLALDDVADGKDLLERHLYARLTNLLNLDLRLVCYDLTSTYFESDKGAGGDRFVSRAFGYSRDRRPDRPQVMIGLLMTGDGFPIAHHVFAGNTSDVSTLVGVLGDLQDRFGVGRICVVADRGLISADNVDACEKAGYDHILATRLHRDARCATALEASRRPDAHWVPAPQARAACCDVEVDGDRYIVVCSPERVTRDQTRTRELIARTETRLLRLENRVRRGELTDAGEIGRAAQRILNNSGVARVFSVEIGPGYFLYDYDDDAYEYEHQLAGCYVLATSPTPTQASAPDVVGSYRQLTRIEHRFRVLKDLLGLRPVYHWTERRVRGHIAVCVLANLIEALIEADLRSADIRDPDLGDQHLSTARALRDLDRIRQITITAALNNKTQTTTLVTRRTPDQQAILAACGVDTTTWTHPKTP